MATVNDPIDFSKLLYTLQVVEDSRDSDHFYHFPTIFSRLYRKFGQTEIGGFDFG